MLAKFDGWFEAIVQQASRRLERLTGHDQFAQARLLIGAFVVLSTVRTWIVRRGHFVVVDQVDQVLYPVLIGAFVRDYLVTFRAQRAALCAIPAKQTFWIAFRPPIRGLLATLTVLTLPLFAIPPYDLAWLTSHTFWIWPALSYLLDLPPHPPVRSAVARALDRIRNLFRGGQPAGVEQ